MLLEVVLAGLGLFTEGVLGDGLEEDALLELGGRLDDCFPLLTGALNCEDVVHGQVEEDRFCELHNVEDFSTSGGAARS